LLNVAELSRRLNVPYSQLNHLLETGDLVPHAVSGARQTALFEERKLPALVANLKERLPILAGSGRPQVFS
jgi:predicted amidohydrolase